MDAPDPIVPAPLRMLLGCRPSRLAADGLGGWEDRNVVLRSERS